MNKFKNLSFIFFSLAYAVCGASLHEVAGTDDLVALELLLSTQDVNGKKLGRTPLIAAVKSENKKKKAVIKMLLSAKADVDLTDLTKVSPLIWAAQICDLEIVELLLSAGADFAYECSFGTAMALANKNNQPKIMSAIIARSIKNQKDLCPKDWALLDDSSKKSYNEKRKLRSIEMVILDATKINDNLVEIIMTFYGDCEDQVVIATLPR